MLLEKEDQAKKLADFRANTKEITEAAKAGNLKEVIEKSKKLCQHYSYRRREERK